MPFSVGKNMRYVHFAEICEKCSNMRNMRQSHIRVKLTWLSIRLLLIVNMPLFEVHAVDYKLTATRYRLECGSRMTTLSTTSPYRSKYSRNVSSVVSKCSPPTNSFRNCSELRSVQSPRRSYSKHMHPNIIEVFKYTLYEFRHFKITNDRCQSLGRFNTEI